MDSIRCLVAGHNEPAPEPPRTPTIELTGVIRPKFGQSGKLYAAITDGRFQWSVLCKPVDLQSFAKFQAVVAEQHDLWISHASQEEARVNRQREEWRDAVSAAYARGDRT